MDERLINVIVFMATVLAVGLLCYRLGFIRGAQMRRRHKITPNIVEEEPTK
jgi:hypothetical protein